MPPPQAGNQILVPIFDAEGLGKLSTVEWSQNLSTRTAQYYALTVDNITTGEQSAFFIAAELYKTSTAANPKHITRVGELVSGGMYQHTQPQSLSPFLFHEEILSLTQFLLPIQKVISSQSIPLSNTVRRTRRATYASWSTTTRSAAHINIASSRPRWVPP